MNIGISLVIFPLACVAGEMENPGLGQIRLETVASLKTLSQEVTAAEKQSFQVPAFDGTRYSIPGCSSCIGRRIPALWFRAVWGATRPTAPVILKPGKC